MMRSEFFLLKNSWIVREKGVVFKKLLNYAYVGKQKHESRLLAPK